MRPKLFARVDKKGHLIAVTLLRLILLQIAFGLLGPVNEADVGAEVFNWLLTLSGLSNFFIWGSILPHPCPLPRRLEGTKRKSWYDSLKRRISAFG